MEKNNHQQYSKLIGFTLYNKAQKLETLLAGKRSPNEFIFSQAHSCVEYLRLRGYSSCDIAAYRYSFDNSFQLVEKTMRGAYFLSDMDPAFIRAGRIDEVMLVLPPDSAAREQILDIHCRMKNIPLDPMEN